MENITTSLTNKLIKAGYSTWSKTECIGAKTLGSALEYYYIDYSYINWMYETGEVHINNKLYEVSAFNSKGNPIDLTLEKATLMNFFFPKRIIFKFEEIKSTRILGY